MGNIANIEPIKSKIIDIEAGWASKAIATGDPHIRSFLEETPHYFPPWYAGTGGPQTSL